MTTPHDESIGSVPRGSTPVPDPTLLTTQQLLREMANLKEVVFTRLDGMDEAVRVFKDDLVRVPTAVDRAVHAHEVVVDEKFLTEQAKFDALDKRFEERDHRFAQAEIASREAIATALNAAKEVSAIQAHNFQVTADKSELSFTKQIDALALTHQTAMKGIEGAISDLKDRLTRIESTNLGRAEANAGNQAQGNWTIQILLSIPSVVLAIALLVVLLSK